MSRAINGSATDDAIAKLKDLIRTGEFGAGSKLPNERNLALRFGLSRSSLREALRALTLVGVVEPRVGDGTYVTALDTDMLLAGIGLVSDLLAGSAILDMHDVRVILEPEATRRATSRMQESDFVLLARCLDEMERAETRLEFADAYSEFHRIIANACGNPMLASLVQTLSRGTAHARLWHLLVDREIQDMSRAEHQRIFTALIARDEVMAGAADLMHLAATGEWLRTIVQRLEEDPAWCFSAEELTPSPPLLRT
jgi:DNA-binding FadR family transcriptional regulator